MILTKTALLSALEAGDITCEPAPQNIGPNSVDCSLGHKMKVVRPNCIGPGGILKAEYISTTYPGETNEIKPVIGPGELKGFWIDPGYCYLGHTAEAIGSDKYVPMLETRSTLARHGLSVHISAGAGDIGFKNQWVLEIVNYTQYPAFLPIGARVGQVLFYQTTGEIELYKGKYNATPGVVTAKGIFDK